MRFRELSPVTDPRPRRSELVSRALSASAGLVAVCALAVSAYQAMIMRQQLKASAWPYLIQGNSGTTEYSRIVQNVGLGPALIRSFVVEVDGRPVHYWGEARELVEARATAPLPALPANVPTYSSTLARGLVLLPGAPFDIYHVASEEVGARMRQVFTDHRLRMRVCYCSLYDDCWTSDTRAHEPVPTRACPDDPTREFER